MNTNEATIYDALREETAEPVLALSDPLSGGPLRIEYCVARNGSHIRVTGTKSGFIMRMTGLPLKPLWVEVLGADFLTKPKTARHGCPQKAAYWTLCILAYGLGVLGMVCLFFGIQILPYKGPDWPGRIESDMCLFLSFVASVGLIPLTRLFRRRNLYFLMSAGAWLLQAIQLIGFPVF